jgi:hypothetical protein
MTWQPTSAPIQRFSRVGLLLAACLLTAAGAAVAQQRYELIVPGSGLTSRAERTDQRLRVEDAEGNVTVYVRDPRQDTVDGMWLGYVSAAARQVIRWPVNDRGPLQVASDARPLVFRESRMEVRPVNPVAPAVRPGPVHPARIDPVQIDPVQIDPEASYRLVPVAPSLNGRALASDAAGDLILRPQGDEETQLWHLTTLAPGVVRVHSDARGRRWSLAGRPDDGPHLARTSESLDQLWQIVSDHV